MTIKLVFILPIKVVLVFVGIRLNRLMSNVMMEINYQTMDVLKIVLLKITSFVWNHNKCHFVNKKINLI